MIPPLIDVRGHREPSAVYLIGGVVFILFVGAGIVGGLLIGRRIVGDRIEAAMREPGGKWRHGRLEVDSADVTFERYRWQMRIPSGKQTAFSGVHLGEDTGQRPPFRQLWTINPQLHIVAFDSDQGHYEIAALPSRLQELDERLHEVQVPR